jgi:hypothetical protein
MPAPASSVRKALNKLTKLPEHAPLLARLGFARYKIFIQVIPIVLISVAVRATLEVTLPDFDGLIQSSTVTPFATASMFVIALMLAGVLEDYKEAERIPALVANIFDSLSEKIEYCAMITRRKKAAIEAKEAAKANAGHGHKEEGHGHGHGGEEEEEEFDVIDSEELHGELLNFLTYFFEFLASIRSDQDMSAIATTYSKWFGAKLDAVSLSSGGWEGWALACSSTVSHLSSPVRPSSYPSLPPPHPTPTTHTQRSPPR